MDRFLLTLVITGTLGIVAVAGVASLARERRPAVRFTVVATLLLLYALFALLPLTGVRTD
ncbi:MAG: hypothetical protein AB1671_14115 [Thermodesulfobacteriota bacterium]